MRSSALRDPRLNSLLLNCYPFVSSATPTDIAPDKVAHFDFDGCYRLVFEVFEGGDALESRPTVINGPLAYLARVLRRIPATTAKVLNRCT